MSLAITLVGTPLFTTPNTVFPSPSLPFVLLDASMLPTSLAPPPTCRVAILPTAPSPVTPSLPLRSSADTTLVIAPISPLSPPKEGQGRGGGRGGGDTGITLPALSLLGLSSTLRKTKSFTLSELPLLFLCTFLLALSVVTLPLPPP